MPLKNIKQSPEKLEIKITNFDFFLILVVGTHWLESKIEKSLKITRKLDKTKMYCVCHISVKNKVNTANLFHLFIVLNVRL
jgi:hypothetical protein